MRCPTKPDTEHVNTHVPVIYTAIIQFGTGVHAKHANYTTSTREVRFMKNVNVRCGVICNGRPAGRTTQHGFEKSKHQKRKNNASKNHRTRRWRNDSNANSQNVLSVSGFEIQISVCLVRGGSSPLPAVRNDSSDR